MKKLIDSLEEACFSATEILIFAWICMRRRNHFTCTQVEDHQPMLSTWVIASHSCLLNIYKESSTSLSSSKSPMMKSSFSKIVSNLIKQSKWAKVISKMFSLSDLIQRRHLFLVIVSISKHYIQTYWKFKSTSL